MATVVLVTVEHAGRTWRLSSRPISITDAAGVSRLYRGGIAPMEVYSEAVMFGEGTVQSQTFDLLPDVDIAGLVDDGHLSSEIQAEVATIEDGQALDMRKIRLTGRASVESDGRRGKPLRISVSADDPAKDTATHPAAAAAASDETLGLIGVQRRAAEDGRGYPTVFGRPGSVIVQGSFASLAAVPVIPCLRERADLVRATPWGLVDQWWVWPGLTRALPYGIISEGWLYPGPSTSAQQGIVKGFTISSGSTIISAPADYYLVYGYDGLGRRVTMVDGLVGWNGLTFILNEDASYYVAISAPCSGVARSDYLGGLEGAGEIVRWALERSSVTVDWRRTTPVLSVLDRYELAGFWDQPCSPWAWLVDNVFPLLPCSWVSGPHGVYPVVWRLDATIHNCDTPPFIDGLNCSIDGPITYEGDPMSAFSMEYAQGLHNGTLRRTARWHGSPTRTDTRESMSLHLRRAQQRYGTQVGAEIKPVESLDTSDLIYSDQSSDRVLGWKSRALPEPRRVIRIVGDGLHHRAHLAKLEPGMAVPFESAAESITRRVAYVSRAGRLGALIYADLVILSQP